MILLKYIGLRIRLLTWCSLIKLLIGDIPCWPTCSAKWVYLTKCNLSWHNLYPVVYNRVHTYAPGRNGRVHMCTKSYRTEYTCVPYRIQQNTHVYEEVDTCSQMYKRRYIHVCTTGNTRVQSHSWQPPPTHLKEGRAIPKMA